LVKAAFFGASRIVHPVGIFTGTCRCPDWAIEGVFIPAGILRNAVVCPIYLLPITLITNIVFKNCDQDEFIFFTSE